MEAKKLFGYAAAMSLLAFGIASCEEPENPGKKPTPGPSATVRFSVEVTEVTETSAKAEVTVRGDEAATWYAFVTEDLDTDADDLITSAVGELSDIESALKTGNGEVEFTDLTAGTDYRVIVTGLAADGTVSGRAADEEFTTSRDPNAWNVNPGWSISYAGRGSYEIQSGTMYGDRIDIVMPEDDLNYYYILPVSVTDFEQVYHSSVAALANPLIEEFNAMIEENNTAYPDNPVFITDLLYSGANSWIMEPLANEQQYLFMIGIEPNGAYGEGLGLYAQSEAFTPAVEESSDGYKKWLGEWTLSGTGVLYDEETGATSEGTCSNTVTIVESIPNYEYTVYGWQQGLMGSYGESDAIGSVARYDASTGALSFVSSSDLGQVNTGSYGMGTVEFLGYCDGASLGYPGEDVSINGEYDIAIATMSSEGTVTVTAQSIPLMGGQTVELIGMQYYAMVTVNGESGRLYWYAAHPRFSYGDFTMVKNDASGADASSASVARSSVRIVKKEAAARTYFPMNFSYMVK